MKSLYNKCLFYCYRDLSITICSIVIMFLLVGIFCILLFVKFDFCYRFNGLVLKDGDIFYVSTLLGDSELKKIQNFSFLVDKKKTDYYIRNISSEYVLTENGLKREVSLEFNIEDDKKIVNNVIDLTFIDKKTIFENLKERFK